MAAYVDIHRAALLLLDLQRDALHPEGAAARHGLAGIAPDDAAPLVGAWQQLADTMRAAGRPVVWVTTAFRPDYQDAAVAPGWLADRRGPEGGSCLVAGSWGAALLDGLEPDPGDYFVVKQGHGAFAGTALDRLLANLGVDQLLIAGGGVVDTVTDTVRTAGLLGYWTHVVQDALYPLDAPELRTPGLRVPGGQRTSLAEVLQLVANTERAAEIDASAPGYAMLIIDMQNDFIRPDRPPVVYSGAAPIPPEKRERMLGNASGAAAAMRARGWPVVYLKISWRTDQLDSVHPNGNGVTERFPEGVTYLVNDSWGTEVVAELAPQPGDFVVEKKGASGFGLTYLHRLLRNLGVHRCLVAGGSVTGCVRATVMDGTALGYDMTVLADATYPPESPQPHLDFLAPWARVRTTDEVIAELAQMTAGAPIA